MSRSYTNVRMSLVLCPSWLVLHLTLRACQTEYNYSGAFCPRSASSKQRVQLDYTVPYTIFFSNGYPDSLLGCHRLTKQRCCLCNLSTVWVGELLITHWRSPARLTATLLLCVDWPLCRKCSAALLFAVRWSHALFVRPDATVGQHGTKATTWLYAL